MQRIVNAISIVYSSPFFLVNAERAKHLLPIPNEQPFVYDLASAQIHTAFSKQSPLFLEHPTALPSVGLNWPDNVHFRHGVHFHILSLRGIYGLSNAYVRYVPLSFMLCNVL